MKAEIQWQSVKEGLPDSDSVVLIALNGGDEPVWMGFHDGKEWWFVDASTVPRDEGVNVTHWADLPERP